MQFKLLFDLKSNFASFSMQMSSIIWNFFQVNDMPMFCSTHQKTTLLRCRNIYTSHLKR